MRLPVAIACALMVHCLCTDEDATMAREQINWRDLVVYMQRNGDATTALRAGITCVRMNSSDPQCNTLVGSMLSFTARREIEAVPYFRRAAIAAPSVRSMANLGLAWSRIFRNEMAAKAYQAALESDHGSRDWLDALYRYVECRQIVCSRWEEFDQRMNVLRSALDQSIDAGILPISPFLAMSLPLSAEDAHRITFSHASIAVKQAEKERRAYEFDHSIKLGFPLLQGLERPKLMASSRLRVVYLAAHFDRRKLMNGFLESVWRLHDRERIHAHCVAWGSSLSCHCGVRELHATAVSLDEPADALAGQVSSRPWISSQIETFVDARGKSDLEAAAAVNALGAHVLVELAGWYPEARPGIVAMRPARVQALYRFIGSGGGRGDDVYVTDSVSFPPELQHLAAERLLYLQPLYLASSHASSFPKNTKSATRSVRRRREEAREGTGLASEHGTLLGALNKPYKFTPQMFDVWCRLLRELPEAKLVVIQYKHYWEAPDNLRREAAERGIEPRRVVAAGEGNQSFFLELGAGMDLFLDTSAPLSNGHTTVADMLWAGVPVVTLPGPSKPSRVAASIALASRCAALLARTLDDYSAVAAAALRGGSGVGGDGVCAVREEVYAGEFFMARWTRALFAIAQFPDAHLVIPETPRKIAR